MKIALITTGTINSSISSRGLAFAKELNKRNHDIYIFSPRFDKYSNFRDEKIVNIDGIKIMRPIQIKNVPFQLSLIPYIVSSLILLFQLKPDIVHIFKTNPITITGLIMKFIHKTPVIVDVDDLDSEVMKIEGNNSLMINLVNLSEKILLRQATAITVASHYLLKRYSSKYKTKTIYYIPNGAEFKNTYRIQAKKLSTNRIIFIGNINRKNILEPLFYAIKNLKEQKGNIKTIIIGDGQYLKYFKKLATNLNIAKEIEFLGFISQNNLYKYIKTGDIGYCFMPNELTTKACSNMKVFHYMQYGAAPLVSNVGDLPTYVSHGKAGYIAKKNNIHSLTATLKKALSENTERRKKINTAFELGEKKYSWLVLSKKVELLYKRNSK